MGSPVPPTLLIFSNWEAKVLEINAKLKAKSIDDPDSDKGHALILTRTGSVRICCFNFLTFSEKHGSVVSRFEPARKQQYECSGPLEDSESASDPGDEGERHEPTPPATADEGRPSMPPVVTQSTPVRTPEPACGPKGSPTSSTDAPSPETLCPFMTSSLISFPCVLSIKSLK